jgi:hypothetical protein
LLRLNNRNRNRDRRRHESAADRLRAPAARKWPDDGKEHEHDDSEDSLSSNVAHHVARRRENYTIVECCRALAGKSISIRAILGPEGAI